MRQRVLMLRRTKHRRQTTVMNQNGERGWRHTAYGGLSEQ